MIRDKIRNSLKGRLFYTFIISIILTLFSFGFSLINTLKLQTIANQRFTDEQYFIEIEGVLKDIQAPLISYLSLFSTQSLSKILKNSEHISSMIPQERPIYNNELELTKREIYFLIDSYLGSVENIVEEKRGRKVEEYSRGFEELTTLYNYILDRIDSLSLLGFRHQLSEYNNFLILFKKIQIYSLILILLVVTLAFSVLMANVNSISNPLYRLSDMADKISGGNFRLDDIHIDSVDEINSVSIAFNKMKNGIRHYIDELNHQKDLEKDIMAQRLSNLKMEQVLKRMELYTMQAQMNPHFLFNTINTGVQLAIIEEAERTADYMENLADLFRYNIREKRFFVPLRKEYEGMLSYINILKIRFPHTLDIKMNIDEKILDDFECPAMILQPLVENTIIHAFKDSDNVGSVLISIRVVDHILEISVKDNGIGMSSDVIDKLLIPHTHEYKTNSKVMGLENVIQRCFFFYPGEEIVEIISNPGNGTNIIIKIDPEVEPCIEL
ncbi:sensor histidine kinase [Thiospirochaeta perfilievii]|uniref:sensor histidine kinase n=1 Tax=Thiospirochaeta perfilievii TaxID=252967 RepID=UPI0016598C4E|nr:histidine kinase [Thiospirochaeta perfilievii]